MPARLAGRRKETGTTRADGAPRGAPRLPRVRPISAAVRGGSRSASNTKLCQIRDVVQDLHQEFHTNVVAAFLTEWRQYVYRLSVTLLTRARKFAAAERRRLNSLNYGDLLNLSAHVLRENEAVRRALQQKFRYLLVDEFQDTDPVQAQILFWLAEDGTSNSRDLGAADWRTLPLRPGALFVVSGRRAEPAEGIDVAHQDRP